MYCFCDGHQNENQMPQYQVCCHICTVSVTHSHSSSCLQVAKGILGGFFGLFLFVRIFGFVLASLFCFCSCCLLCWGFLGCFEHVISERLIKEG